MMRGVQRFCSPSGALTAVPGRGISAPKLADGVVENTCTGMRCMECQLEKMLKMSSRYCKLCRSKKGRVLRNDTSPLRYIGARRRLRPVFPKDAIGGGVNAAVLNQLVRVCAPWGSCPGTRFARSRSPKGSPVKSVCCPRPQQKTLKGTPVARVTIPLVSQLPRIQLAGPSENLFPLPTGKSYT